MGEKEERVSVTIDWTQPRPNTWAASGDIIQHGFEYASADRASIDRGAANMDRLLDRGVVFHHMSGPTFSLVDVEPTPSTYNWRTSGSRRGLFEPDPAAPGNLPAVPAMNLMRSPRKGLIAFGIQPWQNTTFRDPSRQYDWCPADRDHISAYVQTVCRVVQESKNRGQPIRIVNYRQELKGLRDRSFAAGGDALLEVDIYNALEDGLGSEHPDVALWGPHWAAGGTRNLADRLRPMRWAWDRDFVLGWIARARRWDRFSFDWSPMDYGAQGPTEGVGNLPLAVTFIAGWRTLCEDLLAELPGTVDKPKRIAAIESYALDVNLSRWPAYSDQVQAACAAATGVCQMRGGLEESCWWQFEGGWVAPSTFQNVWSLIRKTGRPDAAAGTPYPAFDALMWLHDEVDPGEETFPVETGDPRVYGLATRRRVLLVNLNQNGWSSSTAKRKPVALDAYSWGSFPAPRRR